MSCSRGIEELSAWIDGELPDQQAMELAQHLAGCSRCQAAASDLLALVAAAAGLATSTTSAINGWPRLERELLARHQGKTRRWLPRLLAAAALLLVAIGAVLTLRGRGTDTAEARAHYELLRLRQQQERTLGALQDLVQRQSSGWDKSLRQTFARNSALVDTALEDCRRALSERPTDLALRARLVEAYQRKVEFLSLFSGLSDSTGKDQP